MLARRILILAGTSQARELANELVAGGIDTVSSFAGVTRRPHLPRGEIRTGGFGGVEGLAAYLKAAGITHVIDATHPFAAQMAAHAVAACEQLRLPLLRLERPEWQAPADSPWIDVVDMEAAARALPAGAHVLLTTGHKDLGACLARADVSGVVRTIEPPRHALPAQWILLQDRPPYGLEEELTLFRTHGFTHLIAKNSGGSGTEAKLAAAADLRVQVIMIARPKKPACPTVSTVDEAAAWARGSLGIGGEAS